MIVGNLGSVFNVIELGKIVKAWITFEHLFDLMLQKLAGFDDRADPTFTSLTAHSSFPQRLDMFKSLCDQPFATRPHLLEYKKVTNAVAEAQRLRNFFMHNMIGINEDGSMSVSKISARGELKMELRPIQLSEVVKAHQAIIEVGRDIYRLVLNSDPWA